MPSRPKLPSRSSSESRCAFLYDQLAIILDTQHERVARLQPQAFAQVLRDLDAAVVGHA
ncbi:MAG: hypothetical protein U5Q44_00055 [Dehalococcoidia bacterium]|nr:hypothetical protein [Dehalococcoidia bacterium]